MLTAYFGLFAASFGAATILPGSSELVLGALLLDRPDLASSLVAVATVGNTLGALVNWALGRFLLHWRDRRWFPVKPKQLESASRMFRRFGYPLLLLSWVPIIGDPYTLAAGAMQARLLPFLVLVAIGKGLRYLVLAQGMAFALS
jgi:membrane protein YqaA with SNARE-associated domain